MEYEHGGATASSQADVARKVGWSVLRLQQYELLMKKLLANSSVAGYADELATRRADRLVEVQKKTLGQVVGELTETAFCLPTHSEEENGTGMAGIDPTNSYMDLRWRLVTTEEEYERIRQGLAELVAIRNELVHHFLEHFDLSTESGCSSAICHLDELLVPIEKRFAELNEWVEGFRKTRRALADLVATQEFKNWFMYGATPGGEVDWPNSRVVDELCLVERQFQEDGWTRLSRAIGFLRTRWPELSPKIYGCSSWRHVIHESKLFEIQKRVDPETGIGQVWFRSKSTLVE